MRSWYLYYRVMDAMDSSYDRSFGDVAAYLRAQSAKELRCKPEQIEKVVDRVIGLPHPLTQERLAEIIISKPWCKVNRTTMWRWLRGTNKNGFGGKRRGGATTAILKGTISSLEVLQKYKEAGRRMNATRVRTSSR